MISKFEGKPDEVMRPLESFQESCPIHYWWHEVFDEASSVFGLEIFYLLSTSCQSVRNSFWSHAV